MARRNKKNIKKQVEQFKKFTSTVINYPVKAIKTYYDSKSVATVIMTFLLILFSIGVITSFWKIAWAPYLTTWNGIVIKKDTKISNTGQSQIIDYMVTVERIIGKKTERSTHVVDKNSYLKIAQADKVYKPFFYSRIIKEGESRIAARQLQDFTIIFMSIILFLFTMICGNSFIAVIFVSLFLYDPRKKKNGKKK